MIKYFVNFAENLLLQCILLLNASCFGGKVSNIHTYVFTSVFFINCTHFLKFILWRHPCGISSATTIPCRHQPNFVSLVASVVRRQNPADASLISSNYLLTRYRYTLYLPTACECRLCLILYFTPCTAHFAAILN